ncbi:hypothetical protein HWV62_34597 [Athelia sp. TMB]|nr:hypothetical protein HWV62_34597 [Athelia sp. TMB]
MNTLQNLDEAMEWLWFRDMTPASFMADLLQSDKYTSAVGDLFRDNAGHLLQGLNTYAGREMSVAAHELVNKTYTREILALSNVQAGLQFRASSASAEQVAAFNIADMETKIRQRAPGLWSLMDNLLSADPRVLERRSKGGKASVQRMRKFMRSQKALEVDSEDLISAAAGSELEGADSDDEYWREAALLMEAPTSEELHLERSKKLLGMKKIVLLSMLVQSTNHKCNALQSLVGLFLQSSGTPETVVELLARLGILVTTTSINNMVNSLSSESSVEMKRLGLHNTLIHLTSGTMIPLEHGVTSRMLACSEFLWKKHKRNPKVLSRDLPPPVDYTLLLDLYPEDEDDVSGLTRRERFNTWVFLRDLITHGPEYFRQFRRTLGQPETILQIPITKSKQVPCRMMDINPSTTANNTSVLEDLFRQGGVGDSSESGQSGVRDIGDQVVLVHGDLLTGERIQSLQDTRSEEATPWRRFQFVVYVMGLFHLKMVCADALWRIHIQALQARGQHAVKKTSPNSLMSYVSVIRPRETGKMESKPGFRRVHETIEHVGAVMRLDCWRLAAVQSGRGVKTLEDFADLRPQWKELEVMAARMVQDHVATFDTLTGLRDQSNAIRDQERENTLLRHQHFLLYEEMSYAMNEGDIGRVEDAFMPWVFIFKGCGKHKYAAHMMKHLHNLHFVYPEGLRRAIQTNIMCNLTGTKGRFRAIDWWVEHNNLYLKRVYGGQFSNHTKARILGESPLIELYKNTHIQVENIFHLDHRTTRHSAPDMGTTFQMLGTYMAKNQTNKLVPGRKSPYSIPDANAQGMHMALTSVQQAHEVEDPEDPDNVENEGRNLGVEEDGDVEQEVDDDGGLDM